MHHAELLDSRCNNILVWMEFNITSVNSLKLATLCFSPAVIDLLLDLA